MAVGLIDIGVAIFLNRDVRALLGGGCGGNHWAPGIEDRTLLQDVAEIVNVEGQVMRDAWVVRLLLVVIGDLLAWEEGETGVGLILGGLETTQPIGVLR